MRIGVLTSGGDCPGLNACLRSIFLHASQKKWEVIGIQQGTTGLIQRPLLYKNFQFSDFLGSAWRMAGTMLGTTTRDNPFHFPNKDGTTSDRSQDFIQGFHDLKLEALLGIGGDGSLKILNRLCKQGNIPLIAIPKTIDNDVPNTDLAIGHISAVESVTKALDCLQTTTESHQRIMIVEVMGRDAGYIALNAGIAGGADVILLPEIPYKIHQIQQHLRKIRENGQDYATIVVSESVRKENGDPLTYNYGDHRIHYGGIGHYLMNSLKEGMEDDFRVTVLGHLQRGGTPRAIDRLLAFSFGAKAIELINQGKFGRMVVLQNQKASDIPLSSVVGRSRVLQADNPLIQTAITLGIYVGDF